MATPSSLKLLQPTSKKQRLVRLFAIFLATIGLCGCLDDYLFTYLEGYTENLRLSTSARYNGFYNRQNEWIRNHIIVVTRSDDSFEKLRGARLPRTYHAKLIRDLTRAGAKVIAFDYLFSAETPEDDVFAQAASQGPVVWGAVVDNSQSDASTSPQLILPNAKLLKACPNVGHIDAPIDSDLGQVIRIPALAMDGKNVIPAFSVEIARMARGMVDQPLERATHELRFGSFSIPLSADGTFRIKYFGADSEKNKNFGMNPGSAFQTIPYERIYDGANSAFYREQHYFRDKIIIIGDVTKAGNDHRATPLGDISGVEIHAYAVATLLEGSSNAPAWVNIALIALAVSLVFPVAANCRAVWTALWFLGLLVGTILLNLWFFVTYGISTHLIAPCAALVISTLAVLVERSLSVERDKVRTQALLQRYVSPQVANYVLTNPDKCLLGGVRITATVLFSDIRGFTALSEHMTPEEVLERLNEYLEAMTQVVFKHDGTVDKYIGDAIMAIFGAPVPHPDHARRAVATALDMQSALLDLQEKWKQQGLPIIDIGIGINTGEMIIGNMGAKDRMDFSVLGDSVNLASRVESLNKETGTRILITDATYALLGEALQTRGPIEAQVKGKTETVIVYEVLDWK